MGAFIVKQPKGKYCRFSTILSCPTDWNMTKEDYVELCKKRAEKEALDVLENYICPFEYIEKHFRPDSMSEEKFAKALKEMEMK